MGSVLGGSEHCEWPDKAKHLSTFLMRNICAENGPMSKCIGCKKHYLDVCGL